MRNNLVSKRAVGRIKRGADLNEAGLSGNEDLKFKVPAVISGFIIPL